MTKINISSLNYLLTYHHAEWLFICLLAFKFAWKRIQSKHDKAWAPKGCWLRRTWKAPGGLKGAWCPDVNISWGLWPLIRHSDEMDIAKRLGCGPQSPSDCIWNMITWSGGEGHQTLKTNRGLNASLLLGQRRRRWPSIETALVQRIGWQTE